MLREIDKKAVEVSKDAQQLEIFINKHEFFIMKSASKFTNQYVTKSHDAWSIALEAFIEAIQKYAYSKGSFLKFAEIVIRQRLIDELRRQTKYKSEIPVDPILFSSEPEEEVDELQIRNALITKLVDQHDSSLKEEIEAITEILNVYGFSFYDLISCSPKAEKTKTACTEVILYMASNPLICLEMRNSQILPLKTIEKNTGVHRKILERHRKYIIAGVEIITGDYPYLEEYMRPFREEKK